MSLFSNKYRIESARLPMWDYGSNSHYFVTICIRNRKHHFGRIVDGEMCLSALGEVAAACWQEIPIHFPFVKLEEYVVMPNHVHGIIIIDKLPLDAGAHENAPLQEAITITPNKFGPQSLNLGSIVRGFKIGVTKYGKTCNADFKWQPRFHEHIIRNEEEHLKIRNYIIQTLRIGKRINFMIRIKSRIADKLHPDVETQYFASPHNTLQIAVSQNARYTSAVETQNIASLRNAILYFLLLFPLITFGQTPLISYVKPLVGTQRMGHTYPGATVPFGSVQLSPETDTLSYELDGKYNKDVYKYCAGYQYEDKIIVGFAHTHFSGTGHSDLGDILIMPTTGKLLLNPGSAQIKRSGYRSQFSHTSEIAEANYYKVELADYNIKAELTTTTRVGFHQYTFPKSDSAHIILDMMYGIYNYPGKNVWTYLRVVNDTLVIGYRLTNGWAKNRAVYFAISFSKPFKHHGFQDNSKKEVYKGFWRKFDQTHDFPEIAGQQIKAWFDFNTSEGEKIKMKVAISPVSMANAQENLMVEVPGWDFERVKKQGQAVWEKELHKIEIKADNETMQNFYTSMYHACIGNSVYMDVNGEYMGLDRNVHKAEGFTNYTTFSLWDTYRALHPLFNVICPKRNADMIASMVAHYQQSPEHMLPVWSNSANENWCMIGYHSVSAIADALVKGTITQNDAATFAAAYATAKNNRNDGLEQYVKLGYVPEDKSGSSVSKTLEYAYDDWCLAQICKKFGSSETDKFEQRAGYFKNVFDQGTGFMRPRLSSGSFKKEFDVLNTDEPGFIEGNTWNYSLYVPHDVPALIKLMGGNKHFVPHLDSLFSMQLPDSFFAHTEDITRDGIIGNYVHGNEPSHHIAYLYNWTDKPWKTQEKVRMILEKMYHPTPDGLSGNDDCGQMSAWYIFSAIGFYPVCPGSADYQLGSPCIKEAVLNLENGKKFTIKTVNQSKTAIYVSKALLNGKPLAHTITHNDILAGGELVFYMNERR